MEFYNKPSPQQILAHHGILGQKWGVRRFQNEDGSLTSAGEKRYGSSTKTKSELTFDQKKKLPTNKALNSFTDDELRQVVERKRLENEYRTYRKAETESQRKALNAAVRISGAMAVTALSVATISLGKEAVKNLSVSFGEQLANNISSAVKEGTKSAAAETAQAARKAVEAAKKVGSEAGRSAIVKAADAGLAAIGSLDRTVEAGKKILGGILKK